MTTTADPKAYELELVKKAQARDLRAFSELVTRYQEKMLHAAYAFLGNREDANDAAQEAFVKAYESLKSFRGDSLFSTWLQRIVINQCKDFLRKKTVRKNMSGTLLQNPEPGKETRAEDKIVSPQPDALQSLQNKETGEVIHAAMKELPEQQQAAFVLRYLEGQSLEQIAAVMEISTGAVKAHLWQAAQKMKEKLTAYAQGVK